MSKLWWLPALSALLLTASPLAAAELVGEVRLQRRGRLLAEDLEAAVISFVPRHGAGPVAPEPPFEMVTEGKDFRPHVLAVPVGSRVRFPNRDPILHNVFSVSGDNSFDLGLYAQGQGKEVTFHEPGVVRVFCNVHHSMVAYVVVLASPYSATPDATGRFRLADLPEGPGTLTVWHERADAVTQEVVVPRAAPLEITLEASRPRLPKHLDKLGRAYGDRRRGYRR